MGVGYLKYCSTKCRDRDKNIKRDYWKGKKQNKNHIQKRIENTNQELKQKRWEESNLKKYGVKNPSKLESVKNKISKGNKGKQNKRTKKWQEKIIESKKRNGTIKHSEETKNKIRDSLNKYHNENFDRDKYISNENNKNHMSGWYYGLYFRSSLELSFLVKNKKIKLQTCENKKYGLKYKYNNKTKMYYPDYTDGNFIYEIKPSSLLKYKINKIKIKTGKKIYGQKYKIITEKDCPYIKKKIILDLIKSGVLKLTKNGEEKLKKYKF